MSSIRASMLAVALGSTFLFAAEPLPHAAYVWQRSWTPAVGAAVTNAAPHLAGFVVLAAETDAAGRTVRASFDPMALVATGRPVGLALRVHPHSPADVVEDLAAQLVAEAANRHVPIAELQLDCDAAESKLDAYRERVAAIRQRIAPTPLTITALPAWLRQPSFPPLVDATDGFVLQVHSLDASLRLFDPAAARAAVRRAGVIGRPFRVALPTYGYVVGVDSDGRVRGVQAEGPSRSWPAGTRLHEVRSDPRAMAPLLAEWNAGPPPGLTGFLWYRLPVAEDRLNWPWATLAAMVAGRVPESRLSVVLRSPQPGLVEVELANGGDAAEVAPVGVRVAWRGATLLACDALAGFQRAGGGAKATFLRFAGNLRLAPGERCAVGWLRFLEAKEVACEAALE